MFEWGSSSNQHFGLGWCVLARWSAARGRLRDVTVTGAFLAEAAATVDNKLNVQGGVLSRYTVGPDRAARFVLVVLTRSESGNADRQVDVELTPPSTDEPLYRRFAVPEASLGDFPGFAFFEIDVNLHCDGRWLVDISGGPGKISLPLVVDEWTPPQTAPLGL